MLSAGSDIEPPAERRAPALHDGQDLQTSFSDRLPMPRRYDAIATLSSVTLH
jgi:hypothetical protein